MTTDYNENPFGANGTTARTSSTDSEKQQGYIPFITNRASNEETIRKINEYIHSENKIQYGWLGNFFGTEKNASKNITFIILAIILFIFCILMFWADFCNIITHSFILSLLDKLLPLFTLAFGYFFGKQ